MLSEKGAVSTSHESQVAFHMCSGADYMYLQKLVMKNRVRDNEVEDKRCGVGEVKSS